MEKGNVDELKRRNLIIVYLLCFMAVLVVSVTGLSTGYTALFITMIFGLMLLAYKKLNV